MKNLCVFLVFVCCVFNLSAQNYWQQKVDYTISVKLDDVNHVLRGQESFVYTNNSPQGLDFIYIHLWPNAYLNGKTALGKQQYNGGEDLLTFGNDSIKGGIDSLLFTVNGVKVNIEFDSENPDIAKLTLPSRLASGGQITVATPFRVKIPSGEISRLGHVGQSYQITQWYPKPAVYDKNGWNPIPYLNQGEFYSEYGTFDVSITVPKNYVIGATGDCQTPSELDFLNKLAETTKANIDSYTTKEKKSNAFPPSSSEWKTVRYTQKDVHDFAWFVDKRYLVLKGEVLLPATNHKVTSWAMFTPNNAGLWKNAIEYINDGTAYYSKWNGDYPYNNVTAVDGTISAGGGMEYPNVTVIGNASNAMELEIVIVHEVGHNWFYGLLGTNERVHGWMDEGMNTLNEQRYIYTKYPNNKQMSDMLLGGRMHFNDLSHYDMSEITYIAIALLGEDQPIETSSPDFSSLNYGGIMYGKTGLVFNYLKQYLGDELFDKCMHTYYDEWHYKHPQPEDMKEVLERVSGKDLSWLFTDLIQTTNHIDVKLCSVKKVGNETTVTVKNKGQVKGPIEIGAYTNGKLMETHWVEPTDGKGSAVFTTADITEIRLNPSKRAPDMNPTNNNWKKEGLFGKIEEPKVEFMIGDNQQNRSNIFWTPVVGGNVYDKFLLGIAVHNNAIPWNPWQYLIAPTYAFGSKRVVGITEISRSYLPKSCFKTSRFGVSVRSFSNDTSARNQDAYYVTVSPYWSAKIGNRKKAGPISQNILVQSMYRLDKFGPSQQELVGAFLKYNYNHDLRDHKISFEFRTDYLANAVNGDNMERSSVEIGYKYRYFKKKNRWVELRAFAGNIWNFNMNNSGNPYNYYFALSGASGGQDVFTEDYFFGRTDQSGTWSQQRMDNMGGFKSTAGNGATGYFGTTSGWLTSGNFYMQLPVGPKFLGAYADLGFYQNKTGGVSKAADAGLAIRIGSIFGVYFPVYQSNQLSNSYGNLKYGNKIRFTLHLNLTNKPFSLSKFL